MVDVPEEVCDLNPQKVCQYGTKLAPNLKPVHECTVIPQETCNLKFTPPRKEQKPLISEWCQDDSPPVPDQVGDVCRRYNLGSIHRLCRNFWGIF